MIRRRLQQGVLRDTPCCTVTLQSGYEGLLRCNKVCWLWFEDKLGITKLSHLRNVETRDLRFSRNTLADENVENPVQNEAEREDETDQSSDPDQLGNQLAGIPVEETCNRPVTPFQLPP